MIVKIRFNFEAEILIVKSVFKCLTHMKWKEQHCRHCSGWRWLHQSGRGRSRRCRRWSWHQHTIWWQGQDIWNNQSEIRIVLSQPIRDKSCSESTNEKRVFTCIWYWAQHSWHSHSHDSSCCSCLIPGSPDQGRLVSHWKAPLQDLHQSEESIICVNQSEASIAGGRTRSVCCWEWFWWYWRYWSNSSLYTEFHWLNIVWSLLVWLLNVFMFNYSLHHWVDSVNQQSWVLIVIVWCYQSDGEYWSAAVLVCPSLCWSESQIWMTCVVVSLPPHLPTSRTLPHHQCILFIN